MKTVLQLSLLQNREKKYPILKKPSKQVTFKLKMPLKFWPKGSQSCNSLMEFFTMYFFFKENPILLKESRLHYTFQLMAAEKYSIY